MKELLTIFLDAIHKQIPDKEKKVAVFFSGGIDSTSVAIALKRLGHTVVCYTGYINDNDFDVRWAKINSEIFGFEFNKVKIPTNNIINDFYTLKNKYQCLKKVHFETVFAFLYLYPTVNEHYIATGLCADAHYGLSRNITITCRHNIVALQKYREKSYADQDFCGLSWHYKLAKEYNHILVVPYIDKSIINFFMPLSWDDVNMPYRKHHIVEAFNDEFKLIKRNYPRNMQCAMPIRELFETLLSDSMINFKNRKDMRFVYKDWEKIKRMPKLL